jgi:hypothetical protein
MIANLYLHPDAFVYNDTDTEDQVAKKLRALVDDMSVILLCYKDENRFKVSCRLFTINVFPNTNICNFAEKHLDHDKKGVFYSMMGNISDEYEDVRLDDLRTLCKYNKNEEEVTSLVVLNVPDFALSDEEKATNEEDAKRAHKSVVKDYITFDEYCIVYNKNQWTHLRRQILGNHPGSHEFFIQECQKYFPRLLFNKNCISSLADDSYDYLITSSRRIVYYLSCLNDKFKALYDVYKVNGCDANTILTVFSGQYGLDEPGSIQQNPTKKDLLKFSFNCSDGSVRDIICEPHLKITQEDDNYKAGIDYKSFHPRIYFNFPDMAFENGIIPIGSIGKHV